VSGKIIKVLENSIRSTGSVLHNVTIIMLFVLVLIGAGDVIGRYFFNRPITGAREIGSLLVAGIVLLGWAYAQSKGAHVRVELIISRFPTRVRAITDLAISIVSLAIFSLVTWQGIVTAIKLWETGRLVSVLLIPLAPFQLMVSIGAFVICLEFIIEIILNIRNMRRAV
jgi:TRAP-type C4-dicarboxylate transport system permease small subunit